MALSNEAYEALQAISASATSRATPPSSTGTPSKMLAELVRPDCSHYMPRAGAVVMPVSTEEVQAIVPRGQQVQVRHQGLGNPAGITWASAMYDEGSTLRRRENGHVQLDMRRMNDIRDRTRRTAIAIVGPYVIHAQLHAEAIKRVGAATSSAQAPVFRGRLDVRLLRASGPALCGWAEMPRMCWA